MDRLKVSQFAVPAVVVLITFLSYSSQYLFTTIEPGPLDKGELIWFNLLIACIWICYARACLTDPGRVPADWKPEDENDTSRSGDQQRHRWCRRCEAFKPPRSHHCKTCARCIPKMDHHCPWTYNCVSHFTFPHFFRFLLYSTTAISYLEYFLFVRATVLWRNRRLPSYLGPSALQMAHLFLLMAINSLTLFTVSIIFFRTVWSLGGNITTIESWEIERHGQLFRRSRVLGGYLDGPDGKRVKIVKQEFPYDIGIWRNLKQGVGTGNLLLWLWPFAGTPRSSGLEFDVNGFEDPNTSWPPPDPDRMPRFNRQASAGEAFTYQHQKLTPEEEVQAFRDRQAHDLKRREAKNALIRRKPFRQRFGPDKSNPTPEARGNIDQSGSESGEEAWQDYDGNRLKDFGLDEDVEFYDEDDVPLAELMRRKDMHQAKANSS